MQVKGQRNVKAAGELPWEGPPSTGQARLRTEGDGLSWDGENTGNKEEATLHSIQTQRGEAKSPEQLTRIPAFFLLFSPLTDHSVYLSADHLTQPQI